MNRELPYEIIVAGVSSGGPQALSVLLPFLPEKYSLPVVVVQHLDSQSENYWIKAMQPKCKLSISEAEEKETIEPGHVYIAPANYHLLVESDRSFSLSADARVNYARPSIDVLFESAARVFKSRTVGLILTGANSDGARGLKKIKESGGLAIVQDPATAFSPSMPKAAIEATRVDHIQTLEQIAKTLQQLGKYETIG